MSGAGKHALYSLKTLHILGKKSWFIYEQPKKRNVGRAPRVRLEKGRERLGVVCVRLPMLCSSKVTAWITVLQSLITFRPERSNHVNSIAGPTI
jgi:hypothetical protein